MKRFLGTTLALLAASLVASTACVANNGSIFVRGVLSPPQAAQAGTCVYQANADGPYLTTGVMDTAFASEYDAQLLVGNQMNQRGSSDEFKVETNRVQLQGSVVRVTDAAGAQLANYTVVGGGFVDPGAGGAPSYSVYGTTLIDPDTSNALRQGLGYGSLKRVITYIKIFGTTLGGQHVESDEFVFPVNVCYGCLVSFPADSQDPSLATPNCLASSSSGGTGTSVNPCVTGQDQPIDCRSCVQNPACDPSQRP